MSGASPHVVYGATQLFIRATEVKSLSKLAIIHWIIGVISFSVKCNA